MRGFALVLLAPASAVLVACGDRPSTNGTEQPLNDDLVLAAEMPKDLSSAEYQRVLASIRSCNVERQTDRVSRGDSARAAELEQQAHEAELFGDQERARALLEKAAALDPENGTALYHLARSSEARHDTAGAVRAYCRYLKLNPSDGDAAEARTRLLALWRPSAMPSTPAVALSQASVKPRVVRRSATVTARASGPLRQPVSQPQPVVATSNGVHTPVDTAASNGEVADAGAPASSSPVAVARQPAEDSNGELPNEPRQPEDTRRSSSRGTTRGAVAGAAVGAIAGAAMGGKLKHVLIGTAAGAVIGAVVGEAASGGSY